MSAAIKTRKYSGPADATELERTFPCTVPWCDHNCRWEAKQGDKIQRFHIRDRASGLQVSCLEYAPGDAENTDGVGIFVARPNGVDDDMSPAQAWQLIADLEAALDEIQIPCPAWCKDTNCGGAHWGDDRDVLALGDRPHGWFREAKASVCAHYDEERPTLARDRIRVVNLQLVAQVHETRESRQDFDASLDFYPDEARRLAAALIATADEVEGV